MSQTEEVKIVFTPSGDRARWQKAQIFCRRQDSLGVDVDSVCGGRAMCGRCQVNVGDGSFAKHGIESSKAHLSEASASEARYAEKRKLAADRRLACQCSIEGDLVIDVPAESQVHNQLVRKAADNRTITLIPPVRLCFIEVREPDMHEPSGDLRRIIEALERSGQTASQVRSHVIPMFCAIFNQSFVKENGKSQWRLRGGNQIIAVWPGLKERILGAAVDVGSTTMSAHICDMNSGEVLASTGIMNPQIRFGEDLMSRVSYGSDESGRR